MLTNSITMVINKHDTLKPLKHPISPSQILSVTLNTIKWCNGAQLDIWNMGIVSPSSPLSTIEDFM